MKRPLVVVVSGAPGSGKTSTARVLAERLPLPLVAKDDIKERLGDSLGTGDLDWSRALGAATWDLLFLLYERLLAGRTSFIAESNFAPDPHRERFNALRQRFPFVPFEVHCFVDPATLAERFRGRQARGERHPVHHDTGESTATAESVVPVLARHRALELSEHVIEVDTGAAEAVDLNNIVDSIREATSGF